MSLAVVKSRLDELIVNNRARVMLMTGGWGGGKTYQWNQAIQRKHGCAQLERYAYVSLFGVNSLAEVKRRVAEESILQLPLPESGTYKTLGEFSSSLSWRAQPWKLVKMLPAVPYLNKLEGLASELSFMAIKQSIVCFDDIERRGAALSLRDLFGLVTYLKEERNCRVLLIANDQRLDDASKGELALLLEKVVDEHVDFKISHVEAVDIGLARLDQQLASVLRPHVLNLQTSNIRAIKKIAELAVELKKVLSEIDSDVFSEALKSLSLFGAGHWLKSDSYPPIEYSTATIHSWSRYFGRQRDVEPTPQERIEEGWDAVISRVGYLATSELDKEIATSVRRGFFVKEDLLPFAQKDAQTADAERRRRQFHKQWSTFFHTIQGDSNVMLEGLYELTVQNLDVISQGDAEMAWQTFIDAKQIEKSEKILERFVAINATSRPGVFAATQIAARRGTDPGFRVRMQQESARSSLPETLVEVLDRLQVHSSYSTDDVNRIANTDFSELEKLLFESDADLFRTRISALIRLRELSTSGNTGAAARTSDSALQLLRNLIANDPLMQVRIGHYLPVEPTVEEE